MGSVSTLSWDSVRWEEDFWWVREASWPLGTGFPWTVEQAVHCTETPSHGMSGRDECHWPWQSCLTSEEGYLSAVCPPRGALLYFVCRHLMS